MTYLQRLDIWLWRRTGSNATQKRREEFHDLYDKFFEIKDSQPKRKAAA